MRALVRRWEADVQGRFMKGAGNTCTARFPWRQEKTSKESEDCTELAATQKVIKLTETKPGNKYPLNTTQVEKSEAV